jgi:hypothetical protein
MNNSLYPLFLWTIASAKLAYFNQTGFFAKLASLTGNRTTNV